jgi:hypothetical protein
MNSLSNFWSREVEFVASRPGSTAKLSEYAFEARGYFTLVTV